MMVGNNTKTIADKGIVVAMIGNPNVGKSTLFNSLTGMKQHTGNWPGKTVEIAQGRYDYKGKEYVLVDLPGTYSLKTQSEEEEVAVEFLNSSHPDCVVVIADSTSLERNLVLVLQVMALSKKIILCLNLQDEASRKGISIDTKLLEHYLRIPVLVTSAIKGESVDLVREKIRCMSDGFLVCNPLVVEQEQIVKVAEQIASAVVNGQKTNTEPIDKIILGKHMGYVVIICFMFVIFFLTVKGANYLSYILENIFTLFGLFLNTALYALPKWLHGLLYHGIYQTVSSVISVMLPPMLIFYPLFSILEDLGYLPRAAFLMDHCFSKFGGCGKQALTTAMGFGCNTVGVMGCRIISSPKERLIAILTNSFIPCNGKFPTLITLATVFLAKNSTTAAIAVFGMVLSSLFASLLVSGGLSRFLKKEESHFVLELPPYRRPCIKQILIRALRDRTTYIVGRAIIVSIPTGALIWCLNHFTISGQSLLFIIADFLNPIGKLLSMNGMIILAFVLSFPANELFLPLLISMFSGTTSMGYGIEVSTILQNSGITLVTAVCMIVFTLFHWPCGTTCLTIRKETGSWKWTMLAAGLPTAFGFVLCLMISSLFAFF